ncbi:MAG: SprT family zinc-dependent metalloprotease [Asticcacaulis sp.]
MIRLSDVTALKALLSPVPPYTSGQVLDFDGYRLRLKVNARAKRISLRMDSKTGEAVVTAPRASHLKDAVAFARSRHDWIIEHRHKQPERIGFSPGVTLSIRGHAVILAERPGVISARPVQMADGTWQLVSSGDARTYSRRIERYLRQQALKVLQAETDRYAGILGVSGVKISLFDARGRWGSCTPSRKTIRYSWRVIMAPVEVLSYLCAHECAHLKHPDHSDRFWAEVTHLFGDYKPARKWLKTEGHSLFYYGDA